MGVYVKGNRWFINYYINGRRKREVVGHIDKITRTQAEKALKARVGEIVQGKFNLETTNTNSKLDMVKFMNGKKSKYQTK